MQSTHEEQLSGQHVTNLKISSFSRKISMAMIQHPSTDLYRKLCLCSFKDNQLTMCLPEVSGKTITVSSTALQKIKKTFTCKGELLTEVNQLYFQMKYVANAITRISTSLDISILLQLLQFYDANQSQVFGSMLGLHMLLCKRRS